MRRPVLRGTAVALYFFTIVISDSNASDDNWERIWIPPSKYVAEYTHNDHVLFGDKYLQYEGSDLGHFYLPVQGDRRMAIQPGCDHVFTFAPGGIDEAWIYVYDNHSTQNISASLCCLDYGSTTQYCSSSDVTSCSSCYDHLYMEMPSWCDYDDALYIMVTVPPGNITPSRLYGAYFNGYHSL